MKKIICIIVLVTPFFSFGQNHVEELYNWFDEKIGFENVNIHQGSEYKKKQRSVNGEHSFFKSSEFVKGAIFYQGEKYSNVYFKYDLYEQKLIVRFHELSSTGVTIQLFNNNVKRFNLHNTPFVWVESTDVKGKSISGFFEEAYSAPSLKLLIKISKHKKEVAYNGRMLAEYKKNRNEYFLWYKNQYTKIKSKKNIINILPSLKKQVNSFYRKHASLRKKNYTLFLAELSRELVKNNNL